MKNGKSLFDTWWGLTIVVAIIIIMCVFIRKNEDRKRDERSRKRQEIEVVREKDAERRLKESLEHRRAFYNKLANNHSFFKEFEEFDEWLDFANTPAIELLYGIFNEDNHDFGSLDSMIQYLHWSPEYEISCDNCGEIITISE